MPAMPAVPATERRDGEAPWQDLPFAGPGPRAGTASLMPCGVVRGSQIGSLRVQGGGIRARATFGRLGAILGGDGRLRLGKRTEL